MKQKIYKKIVALAVFLLAVNFVLAFSSPALALGDPDDLWGGSAEKQYIQKNSGLPAEDRLSDPRRVVVEVIRIILGFLGILAVIIVLYAGFKWMTAGGNEERVGDAKKILIAGLIGLIIIVFSYAIVNFIINQFVDIAT